MTDDNADGLEARLESKFEQIVRHANALRQLPVLDDRRADEILGYDGPDGTPS